MFSQELLQAINDWQRGGVAKQKAKRGEKLKMLARGLPEKFRQSRLCYRQIALHKDALWKLADELELPETISAWTESIEVAQTFKNGVPPPGVQGVIFLLLPSHQSVVVNLNRLYQDEMFEKAVQKFSSKLTGFHDGIGRYKNSQQEVVVEISKIHFNDIHELGGYSSTREEIKQQYLETYYGPNPSRENLEEYERKFKIANVQLGPWWLNKAATERVLAKINAVIPGLRVIKRLQEAAREQEDG